MCAAFVGVHALLYWTIPEYKKNMGWNTLECGVLFGVLYGFVIPWVVPWGTSEAMYKLIAFGVVAALHLVYDLSVRYKNRDVIDERIAEEKMRKTQEALSLSLLPIDEEVSGQNDIGANPALEILNGILPPARPLNVSSLAEHIRGMSTEQQKQFCDKLKEKFGDNNEDIANVLYRMFSLALTDDQAAMTNEETTVKSRSHAIVVVPEVKEKAAEYATTFVLKSLEQYTPGENKSLTFKVRSRDRINELKEIKGIKEGVDRGFITFIDMADAKAIGIEDCIPDGQSIANVYVYVDSDDSLMLTKPSKDALKIIVNILDKGNFITVSKDFWAAQKAIQLVLRQA